MTRTCSLECKMIDEFRHMQYATGSNIYNGWIDVRHQGSDQSEAGIMFIRSIVSKKSKSN